jgi:hypothetical protein
MILDAENAMQMNSCCTCILVLLIEATTILRDSRRVSTIVVCDNDLECSGYEIDDNRRKDFYTGSDLSEDNNHT